MIHMQKKAAGILMPLASLPSREGMGCMGSDAYHFADSLGRMHIRVWQILPLNPLGYGNSPYQPFSSYAGDEKYISLEMLEKDGLLPDGFAPYTETGEPDRIDYEKAGAYKKQYLEKAAQAFYQMHADDPQFRAFCSLSWVYPYAVFMALKRQNGLRPWTDWPQEQKDWILDRKYDLSHLKEQIDYECFVQYVFSLQWKKLKAYANSKGILIMGDIPFYVGLDSLDVWSGRDNFLLNKDGRPDFIAGVPPDFFNALGQRWGNPIYNWEKMEKDGFSFWLSRLAYNAGLYDILRIDHFRAFDTYWKIPASCETAIEGEWIQAPGKALFQKIYEQMPQIRIVAEDLGGDLTPGVHALRDGFGLMGMNVADFTLLSEEEPIEHQLIYTGTHDNQTVRGWFEGMDKEEKARFLDALKDYGSEETLVSEKMVRYVMMSVCELAIVPLADVLDLDDRARLNNPGTIGSPNWEWRLDSYAPLLQKEAFVRALVRESGRDRKN